LLRLFDTHDIAVQRHTGPFAMAQAPPRDGPASSSAILTEGFRLPNERLVVVTEADLFGEARQRRRTQRIEVTQLLKNLSELKPDDFVVHIDHGVGRVSRAETPARRDIEGDFLHLEYAGGDRLYLPVDRISLVQKYVGADARRPPWTSSGPPVGRRSKRKTRNPFRHGPGAARIYAAREVMERRSFTTPDHYFREFEAAFPSRKLPISSAPSTRCSPTCNAPSRWTASSAGTSATQDRSALRARVSRRPRRSAGGRPGTNDGPRPAALQTFRRRLQGYPVRVETCRASAVGPKPRASCGAWQRARSMSFIGTHRLFQKDIVFRNLASWWSTRNTGLA